MQFTTRKKRQAPAVIIHIAGGGIDTLRLCLTDHGVKLQYNSGCFGSLTAAFQRARVCFRNDDVIAGTQPDTGVLGCILRARHIQRAVLKQPVLIAAMRL